MKKLMSLFLSASMLFTLSFPVSARDVVVQFTDVPQDSFAFQDIAELKNLGVATGMGDGTYGIYNTFKRCDFVLMLARLLKWDTSAISAPFSDVDAAHYASGAIYAALKLDVISADSASFRPNDFITRAEMAEMLARALGYRNLADNYKPTQNPFTDVSANQGLSSLTCGAISMAYNFGIINGTGTGYPTQFNPTGVATREQAAAMMMRFYRRTTQKPTQLHAFYAMSSWPQREYIKDTDAISVGWARMEYDTTYGATLNMKSSNFNEYYVPSGAKDLLDYSNAPVSLSVYMDASFNPLGLLQNDAARASAVSQIVAAANNRPAFRGVTIDFEGFVSADFRAPFVSFLRELRAALGSSYTLTCAVPPNDYYKGYDYRAIGEICDKVILMAHDYNPTTLPEYMLSELPNTPVAPITNVYNSLAEITNPITGIADKSKIMLALSFTTARWEMSNGKVNPSLKRSDYSTIALRISNNTATAGYNENSQSPYITYFDPSDNTNNIVWYENEKSLAAKAKMAQMFGIGGISVWRLGIIPENTWQTIADSVS